MNSIFKCLIVIICLYGSTAFVKANIDSKKEQNQQKASFSASVYFFPFELEPYSGLTPQTIRNKTYLLSKIKMFQVKQIVQIASKAKLSGHYDLSLTRVRVDYFDAKKSVILIDKNGVIRNNGKDYRLDRGDLKKIQGILMSSSPSF
jgi:hypothetical protein